MTKFLLYGLVRPVRWLLPAWYAVHLHRSKLTRCLRPRNRWTQDAAGAEEAVNAIARSLSACRFESTDTHTDDAVFMNMLQLAECCVRSPAGTLLHDGAMVDLFRVRARARPGRHCTATRG